MLRYLVPLVLFIVLAGFLWVGLHRDPRLVPSPLIGKPAPEFRLPLLKDPGRFMTTADLKGKVTLFNVWATWCVSCRQEHEVLVELARNAGVRILGLDYKDSRPDALAWLQRLGNPYVAIAFDANGRVGIDWGVYGTPETFVVDRHGIIRYKQIGPITEQVWKDKLQPLIEKLRAES